MFFTVLYAPFLVKAPLFCFGNVIWISHSSQCFWHSLCLSFSAFSVQILKPVDWQSSDLVNYFWKRRVWWDFYWLHASFEVVELNIGTFESTVECWQVYLGNIFWLGNEVQQPLHVLSGKNPNIPVSSSDSSFSLIFAPLQYSVLLVLWHFPPYHRANTMFVVVDLCELQEPAALLYSFALFSCPTTLWAWAPKLNQKSNYWVWNKPIKQIYLGFSGKISSKFQLHVAVSAEDKCITIYHSSLLCKEQGSDVFRLYKPSQTGTLSLVFAHIKYKETYGVTTTFKYNNDCDNASGTEFAFCYTREKRIPDFQWTSGTMTDTTFIAPEENKNTTEKQQQNQPALIELIHMEKQLPKLHKNLKPFGYNRRGAHTNSP